jgi:AmmeMemoRadiSam system protein A
MENILQSLANDAIKEELDSSFSFDFGKYKKYQFLNEKKASFVTLNIDSNLRGCIGSIIPHRSLLEDLYENAKSSAFSDPRFSPLSLEEYNNIDIEISILSEPQHLEYIDTQDLKSKIRVGVDGVILVSGDKQSTFLPAVWEQLSTFELFFAHLCNKAGLDTSCLESHPTIYTYQAQKY